MGARVNYDDFLFSKGEEKIVHILDELEEVEDDINFDIEDEISRCNQNASMWNY